MCVSGHKLLAVERPDLAAQVVDKSLLSSLCLHSNKKIEWECPVGHRWFAVVASRVRRDSAVCPVCSGRTLVPEVNSFAVTHPDLAAQLADPSLAWTFTAGSGKKVEWICPNNPNHRWKTSVVQRAKGRKTDCPYCSHRKLLVGFNNLGFTHPEVAAELVHPEDALTLMANSTRRVEWKCPVCGHVWKTSPNGRKIGVFGATSNCPACSHNVATEANCLAATHPYVAPYLADVADAHRFTHGSTKLLTWRCGHGHEWIASPMSMTHKGHLNLCCPVCYPNNRSLPQTELTEIVRTLVGPDEEILTDCRSVLPSGRELDIYLPSKQVAIEFNGVYFHSECMKKDSKYHQLKFEECLEKDIRLIQIWEDLWNEKKSMVVVMLAKVLGCLDRIYEVPLDFLKGVDDKISADSCVPCRIDGSHARLFLKENCVLGFSGATCHYALVDSTGVFRAVLSIRSPSSSARSNRKPGEWTISRYAELGAVSDGLLVLLKFAESDLKKSGLKLTKWIAFSSNDISDGSEWSSCGFALDGKLAADYMYVGHFTKLKRVGKENFQRKRFRNDLKLEWDESWTEHEAALQNKLYRAYDSGKRRWVKSVGCLI